MTATEPGAPRLAWTDCPFCGFGDDEKSLFTAQTVGAPGVSVRCDNCECRGPVGESVDAAITRWTQRAALGLDASAPSAADYARGLRDAAAVCRIRASRLSDDADCEFGASRVAKLQRMSEAVSLTRELDALAAAAEKEHDDER